MNIEIWSRLNSIQNLYYPRHSITVENLQDTSPLFAPIQQFQNDPPADGFFKSHVFYILGGRKVTPVQLGIFSSNIQKHGGVVESRFTSLVTIVVLGCDIEKVPKEILECNRDIKFVDPIWIVACERESKFVNLSSFVKRKPQNQVVDSENQSKKVKIEQSPKKSLKDYFACQMTFGEDYNHNKDLTTELKKLEEIYNTMKDSFRALSYRTAGNIIKKWPIKITSIKQLEGAKGIGESIGEKIDEFLNYGKITKLGNLTEDERFKIIKLFSTIHGVGPKVANEWFQAGMKTLDDLIKNKKLSPPQAVSLKYLNETQQRIPRSEVHEIEGFVKRICSKSFPNVGLTICGSYRRGEETCGDIDVLVCDPDGFEDTLVKLVGQLEAVGFLVAHLTERKSGSDSYMGICVLGKLHHRMDIKVFTPDQYAFALLQFTGSAYFNRSMKYKAKLMGYRLGDKAIRKEKRNGKEVIYEGDPVKCMTEKDIFDVLEMEYRAPEDRRV